MWLEEEISLFSTQTIGIAISGVATASFAAGFVGADQALKQPVDIEVAQSFQPNLDSTAQSILWYSDNSLNHLNRQVQLAREQSRFESEVAIAPSSYSNRDINHQTDAFESYVNESSWSIFDEKAASASSRSVSPAQDALSPLNESVVSTEDPYLGAANDPLSGTPTEQAERYDPTEPVESLRRSTDYRPDYDPGPRSLKPNVVWQSSPDFVKDYIKVDVK